MSTGQRPIFIQGLGNKCLDVVGGGTADGTRVQVFDCNGTGAQKWVYQNNAIINLQSGKCLDTVQHGIFTDAEIRTCKNSAGQRWSIR
ncbi:MAG: ricin-type beta-trefoil lectin domain protein [Pseudomonadota bacterium]|nr:ricin-type beta-trefoil lectin domain protein [Pseudomonadota bacterium]